MGVGRFIAVLVPISLTVTSFIFLLTVGLGGIANNLYLFELDTTEFSATRDTLSNIAHNLINRDDKTSDLVDKFFGPSDGNITAATLQLADKYQVTLWNYCKISSSGSNCTAPQFNWASSTLNASEIESNATSLSGFNVTLPDEVRGALKSFSTISKWTQYAYSMAAISIVVEIILGLFAFCSRAGSFMTLLICAAATTGIFVASILATVQASAVSTALNGSAKIYHVKSKVNTRFLAVTWLAALFSLGAGLFWAFTSCCFGSNNTNGRSFHSVPANDSAEWKNTAAYKRMEPARDIYDERGPQAPEWNGGYSQQYSRIPLHNQ